MNEPLTPAHIKLIHWLAEMAVEELKTPQRSSMVADASPTSNSSASGKSERDIAPARDSRIKIQTH